ncbi:MAG: DUF4199 domain-containing protein [Bacteroidaceae bacterium]|nr:DUF4199 domain-containing protein [Bacteroidaceae bacterium]
MAEENTYTESQQTRAYAGYYGLWIGLMWAAAFGLTMYGFVSPFAGNLGFIVGICSLPVAISLFRGFREHVAPLPLRRAWYLSWMSFLAAALICTVAQYIYFAYIDDGLLVRSYTEMLQQPEIHDMLSKLLPGQDVDKMSNDALAVFSSTPPSMIATQFLFWNVLLATVVAFPCALMSKDKFKP